MCVCVYVCVCAGVTELNVKCKTLQQVFADTEDVLAISKQNNDLTQQVDTQLSDISSSLSVVTLY